MGNRYSAPDLFMSCKECGKLLITTSSGYLSCPKGHGKLQIAEPGPEVAEVADTFCWDDTCRHCGRDIEQVDGGSIYCGHCVKVLEQHAATAGIGG